MLPKIIGHNGKLEARVLLTLSASRAAAAGGGQLYGTIAKVPNRVVKLEPRSSFSHLGPNQFSLRLVALNYAQSRHSGTPDGAKTT